MSRRILKLCVASSLNILCFPALSYQYLIIILSSSYQPSLSYHMFRSPRPLRSSALPRDAPPWLLLHPTTLLASSSIITIINQHYHYDNYLSITIIIVMYLSSSPSSIINLCSKLSRLFPDPLWLKLSSSSDFKCFVPGQICMKLKNVSNWQESVDRPDYCGLFTRIARLPQKTLQHCTGLKNY